MEADQRRFLAESSAHAPGSPCRSRDRLKIAPSATSVLVFIITGEIRRADGKDRALTLLEILKTQAYLQSAPLSELSLAPSRSVRFTQVVDGGRFLRFPARVFLAAPR
jgi:hypothetical protein